MFEKKQLEWCFKEYSFLIKYDILSWRFGVKIEPEEYWFDIAIEFGPICLNFIRWFDQI